MAAGLGWDDERTNTEIAQYRQAVMADLAARKAGPMTSWPSRRGGRRRTRSPFYGPSTGRGW